MHQQVALSKAVPMSLLSGSEASWVLRYGPHRARGGGWVVDPPTRLLSFSTPPGLLLLLLLLRCLAWAAVSAPTAASEHPRVNDVLNSLPARACPLFFARGCVARRAWMRCRHRCRRHHSHRRLPPGQGASMVARMCRRRHHSHRLPPGPGALLVARWSETDRALRRTYRSLALCPAAEGMASAFACLRRHVCR
jgi:hypothetical protein